MPIYLLPLTSWRPCTKPNFMEELSIQKNTKIKKRKFKPERIGGRQQKVKNKLKGEGNPLSSSPPLFLELQQSSCTMK
jgi:hypothetical protein